MIMDKITFGQPGWLRVTRTAYLADPSERPVAKAEGEKEWLDEYRIVLEAGAPVEFVREDDLDWCVVKLRDGRECWVEINFIDFTA